ncbi:MAG: hypothetical protein KJ556_20945 [Gammaproteobacteria bacterium]|nr:hypothetical protein [Gammaproteobacteria bacterium]MBU2249789.1 hypothetical protein [Gammaproteobacteria bacterium]
MAKLDDCLKAIADIIGRVEGINQAPEYMTDKTLSGVYAMPYAVSGTGRQEPINVLKGLHDIGLYVIMPRVDLVSCLKRLLPLYEPVMAALENNPTLLDTCSTFGDITYTFGYAINVGTPAAPAYVVGWNFTVQNVKIQDETSLDN